MLLKGCDQKLKLSESIALCLDDNRQAGKVRHRLVELLQQRLFGIACGYADGNDAGGLAEDPVFKPLLDRV